jgi:hypothetical protein
MRLSHSNTEAKTESQMTKDLQAHIHQKENPSENARKPQTSLSILVVYHTRTN